MLHVFLLLILYSTMADGAPVPNGQMGFFPTQAACYAGAVRAGQAVQKLHEDAKGLPDAQTSDVPLGAVAACIEVDIPTSAADQPDSPEPLDTRPSPAPESDPDNFPGSPLTHMDI